MMEQFLIDWSGAIFFFGFLGCMWLVIGLFWAMFS